MMLYSESTINHNIEIKMGYNDNLNLGNAGEKEEGRVLESYYNIEWQSRDSDTKGVLKYNFGLLQNQALSVLEAEDRFVFPENKSTRNHLLTGKLDTKVFEGILWGIKSQGEYNDADLDGIEYQKWLLATILEYEISAKTNIGVELNYSRRRYEERIPLRSDSRKVIVPNISYVLPSQIITRLEYPYLTNDSNILNYKFRGNGPLMIFIFPLLDRVDLQLISSYEIRHYEQGKDYTLLIIPSIIKKINNFRILFEYSLQKNNSTISNRDFVQNRYVGGIGINF